MPCTSTQVNIVTVSIQFFQRAKKEKKEKNLPLNHKSNYWCELYENDYKDFLKINHLNIHSFSSLNAFRQCEHLYI